MSDQKIDKGLVLGATGMLGHKLLQVISGKISVSGTVRSDPAAYSHHPVLSGMDIIGNVRADDFDSIRRAIDYSNPDVIINCIGIVKQLPAASDPLPSIAINALFPHQLAKLCREKNVRLIHMSTDCVFSGKSGNYSEDDPSDAEDLYGKTKYLGEVNYPGCLTIRTSIIGRELETAHGLVEWFLAQEGKTISGYKKAIFSGLTTNALSGIIGDIISDYPALHGVCQIASEPISKYDLLTIIKGTYKMNITIKMDETVINDRSLNPARFKKETTIKIPSWQSMITEMYNDPAPYDQIRGTYAQ